MTIRLANISDKDKIAEYCEQNGFNFPNAQSLYLCLNETGNIIGLTGLEHVIKIEPFISSNPIAAGKLYLYITDILNKNGIEKVECFTPDRNMDKVKEVFENNGMMFAERTNRFVKHLITD
jgi:hypothetical protein